MGFPRRIKCEDRPAELACSEQHIGKKVSFDIAIYLSSQQLTLSELQESDDFQDELIRANDIINAAIIKEVQKRDPELMAIADTHKNELLKIFGSYCIYPIVNAYRQNATWYDPWFKVHTEIGVITIGWRNKVIELNWAQSNLDITAEKLFPKEQTSKQDQWIHCSGVDKLKEYCQTLLDQVKITV